MPGLRRSVIGLALGLLLMASPVAWGQTGVVDEALFKEIEKNLMCTDGCGMYLVACDNATAEKMRAEIREKLAEGATADQIYKYMISIYGEEVMAAPPPDNPLNIAAWVLPFIGILAGGLVIYMALDKWVFYRHRKTGDEESLETADLAEYEEILDAEIKKYY